MMYSRIISLIFLWFSMLLVPFFSAAKEPVHLSAGEWAPYISVHSDKYGIFTQIVTESFNEVGRKVDYSFYPWKRAMYVARTGELDGAIAVTKNRQREQEFWFSQEPILVSERVFFYVEDSGFDWRQIGDLQGLSIGATAEYYYGDSFDAAEKNGTLIVDWSSTDLQNFKKLAANRIDIFPITKEIGYFILNREFPADQRITHHPKPLVETPFYIILSKAIPENEQLIKEFDKGFEQLRESGRYQKLITKMKEEAR